MKTKNKTILIQKISTLTAILLFVVSSQASALVESYGPKDFCKYKNLGYEVYAIVGTPVSRAQPTSDATYGAVTPFGIIVNYTYFGNLPSQFILNLPGGVGNGFNILVPEAPDLETVKSGKQFLFGIIKSYLNGQYYLLGMKRGFGSGIFTNNQFTVTDYESFVQNGSVVNPSDFQCNSEGTVAKPIEPILY